MTVFAFIALLFIGIFVVGFVAAILSRSENEDDEMDISEEDESAFDEDFPDIVISQEVPSATDIFSPKGG